MKHLSRIKIVSKSIKKRKTKVFPLLWIIFGIFLVSSVFFTIETATKGAQLAKLEKEEKMLTEENRQLSSQLIQLSSLTNLEAKAKDLGFSKPAKIIYISEPSGVAKVPQQ